MSRRQGLYAIGTSLVFFSNVCFGEAFVPSRSIFGVDVSGTCRPVSAGPQRTHVSPLEVKEAAGENHVASSFVKTSAPPVVSVGGGGASVSGQ